MYQLKMLLVCAVGVAACLQFVSAQTSRNTIPDTVTACYLNTTAYNRFTRQPMHIENLIAIIRKIETKTSGTWDSRRIARTLIHRYMFDGMQYDASARPELAFEPQNLEAMKTDIIKEMIPIPVEEILPDILDNDEKCALHWMLSHSLNATMRDDEQDNRYGLNPGYSNGGNTGNSGYNPGSGFNGGNPGNNNNNGGNQQYPGNNPGQGYQNNNPGQGYPGSYNGRKKREVDEDAPWDVSVEKKDDTLESAEFEDKDQDKEHQSDEHQEQHKNVEDDVEVLDGIASDNNVARSGRQIASGTSTYPTKTRRPLETGIVYTKWGAVAAGRVIAGIAAGLEPMTMSLSGSGTVYRPELNTGGGNPWSGGSGLSNPGQWNSGSGSSGGAWGKEGSTGQQQPSFNTQSQYGGQRYGRSKRQIPGGISVSPLESLYAVTLAGEAGQAAILNGQHSGMQNAIVPTGDFNDTVCPREYVLREHGDPTKEVYRPAHAWSYMTEAEIRGGLDGLILGSIIRRIDPSSTQKLSDILSQYYSNDGIAKEPQFRSCDRAGLLSSAADANKLRDQTISFAYLYNNRSREISVETLTSQPDLLRNIAGEAYQRMITTASSLNIGCSRPSGSTGVVSDDRKETIPKLTVYAVLDHSVSIQEIDQQKSFLGNLAYELNVSPTGSRMGVVDGNAGTILISPNWTDVSPILACRIMSLNSMPKSQDYGRVMSSMKTELEKVRNEEIRYNYTSQNGVVILLMVQGTRLEGAKLNEIKNLRREINEIYGGVTVVATSSKYAEADFEGLTYIKLEQGRYNFSDMADEFAKSLMQKTHGSLRYLYCNAEQYSQENEHKEGTTMYINPGTVEYYKISPEYFYKGRSLVLRFTSYNGRVRVCVSRKDPFPRNQDTTVTSNPVIKCNDTSGAYVVPGQDKIDVEFRDDFLHQPCGKSGKRNASECDPIYVSITPIAVNGPGEIGLDCSQEPCQSPNQVRVTFTHWGLRCNGATRTAFSASLAVITLFITLFAWTKST